MRPRRPWVANRPGPGRGHGPQHRPAAYAVIISYSYGRAISTGVLLADDAALRELDEALRIAERSSEDLARAFSRFTLGVALVHRDSPAERERGLAVLAARSRYDPVACGSTRAPSWPNAVSAWMATTRPS
jgi:hypothetical protein